MKKDIRKWMGLLLGILFVLGGCGREQETVTLVQEETVEESAKVQEGPSENADKEKEEPEPEICIYVCGAVKHPGIYYLKEDARLFEGIQAAGGFTEEADETWWNQAQHLEDGSRIRIYTKEEAAKMAEAGATPEAEGTKQQTETGAEGAAEQKVNINTAALEELQTIPGIGTSKAQAVISYREENGTFSAVEDIQQVPGIKGKTFEKMKSYITVR